MRPKRLTPLRLQVLRVSTWGRPANFKIQYDESGKSMIQMETLNQLYSGAATGIFYENRQKIADYLVENYGEDIGSTCPEPRDYITPNILRLKDTDDGSRIGCFLFDCTLDLDGFAMLIKNEKCIEMGHWSIYPES